MKRLGHFTGKIYTEEDFKQHNIHECCVMITDEQSADNKFVKDTFTRMHIDCLGCIECQESRKVVFNK